MNAAHGELPVLAELSTIAAETSADSTAFIQGETRVTWSEVDESGRRAADAFSDHVGRGDRVAFLCESSIENLTLWNGAVKAGAIVSHVHTRASADTVRYCLDRLGPKVLVVDEERTTFLRERVLPDLPNAPQTVVVIGESPSPGTRSMVGFLDGRSAEEPDVLRDPDDIAVIAWTSGTTGRPKGWCHTNRSVMFKALRRTGAPSRTGRVVTSASPSFMAWYNVVMPIFINTASAVLLSEWDPVAWLVAVEEHGATQSGLVPTMWREILREEPSDYDLSSLQRITFTGEKIDPTTLTRLREEICANVSNAYASTEVNIASIENEEITPDRIESVGKPSRCARVRIVEEGAPPDERLGPGEVGEIIVKAPDRPVWAWGNTAIAEEAFRDGWWYSGDLGYRDADGYLYVEGRKDFMIKSKGVKVIPSTAEERLNNHPRVEEAIVVGVPDEEYGERVTAIVSTNDDVTAEELDEWCLASDSLARFERPRAYHMVDWSIPRTSSNKVDRRAAMERLDLD